MKRCLITIAIALCGLLCRGTAQDSAASSLQDTTSSQTPAPEPASPAAAAASKPASPQINTDQCEKNRYYIDKECRSAHEVATAGNVWFGSTIVPTFFGPNPFLYLNQISLNKERRYLDKLDIKDGRSLFKATRIMKYVWLGYFVSSLAVIRVAHESFQSDNFVTAEVAVVYVMYYTAAIMHCFCDVRQRQLLTDAVQKVNKDDQDRSQKENPVVVPYVSLGPNKTANAGLALRF
jgi:hypothetical protein